MSEKDGVRCSNFFLSKNHFREKENFPPTTLKNYEFGTVEDKSHCRLPQKFLESDKNKAIMLARRNPNMSIAEIVSDLNTTMDAHQVSARQLARSHH